MANDDATRIYRVSNPATLIFRDQEDPEVEGPIVPYGQWSEVNSVIEGHFLERFAPGSLRKSLTESVSRVKGYFEHGRSQMFDRTPIMDIRRTWETDSAPYYTAGLLKGLPEWMHDGIRKGLYGTSVGATPVQVSRDQSPQPSEHNPDGIEERTYTEVRVHDISLTPAPHYDGAVVLRSITDELAVGTLVKHPDRLLQLIRESQNDGAAAPQQDHEPSGPQHSEEAPTREEDKPSWLL
jgi:hypothetical protein